MRQVPSKKYLIIGNGRTAKHIGYYFTHLGHDITYWHYQKISYQNNLLYTTEPLQELSYKNDKILILIKDAGIEDFINQYSFLKNPNTIHFSGSLEVAGISNVHPLISFGQDLFPTDFYPRIPFAQFDSPEKSLESFLPGISNPSFYIPKKEKSLYHGLCVASGNLTVLLWQMVADQLNKNWNLNNDYLKPYLKSVTSNLQTHWETALTGPIARRDEATLVKNYQALQNTPLNEIFKAHIKAAWPEFADQHFDHQHFTNKNTPS